MSFFSVSFLVDLFSVTVHELGHSLGLMHSNIPDAIMFPYYRGYSKSIKLHSDDISAIRKLYGGRTKSNQMNKLFLSFSFEIFSDPPSEVLIPSLSDSDEITTIISPNHTEESHVTTIIPSSSSTTTTTTTTFSTTMLTSATYTKTTLSPTYETTSQWNNSLTTIVLMNEAQLQNELTTLKIPMNRPPNRSMNNPTLRKSTDHWYQSYYQTTTTTTSTESMKINYTDRSKLDLCEGFYDAITMYKGILFIFKGQVCHSFLYIDFYGKRICFLVFLAI